MASTVIAAAAGTHTPTRFNSAEALVYVGGPTAFFLLVGSLIWEDMGPASDAWPMLAAAPWRFFAAFAMSFLVNLSCFFAIQYTSSLTFKASARCTRGWAGYLTAG